MKCVKVYIKLETGNASSPFSRSSFAMRMLGPKGWPSRAQVSFAQLLSILILDGMMQLLPVIVIWDQAVQAGTEHDL